MDIINRVKVLVNEAVTCVRHIVSIVDYHKLLSACGMAGVKDGETTSLTGTDHTVVPPNTADLRTDKNPAVFAEYCARI